MSPLSNSNCPVNWVKHHVDPNPVVYVTSTISDEIVGTEARLCLHGEQPEAARKQVYRQHFTDTCRSGTWRCPLT